jgi:hypothetical protein
VGQQKQLKLGIKSPTLEFGGSKFTNYNPKTARPLAAKTPVHVVMRSPMAKGHLSLLFFDRDIKKIIRKQSESCQIRVYDFANAGNHLHFVCVMKSIRGWKTFIRAVSGLIARLVLKAERGSAVGARFWQGRPWTRILTWGRAYKAIQKYLSLNKLEAIGFCRATAKIVQSLGLFARDGRLRRSVGGRNIFASVQRSPLLRA